jgi:hypothetical protein
MSTRIFWYLRPRNREDCYRCFEGVWCLNLRSTLKMNAVCSSEMVLNLYQTTQRHILEDIDFKI